MLTHNYQMVPLSAITIQRDSRQRSEMEVDEGLLASIKQHGIIQPIVVEKLGPSGFLLVAGERRVFHSREAGLKEIPARLAGDLSHLERVLIEFEENAKRLDLPWKDRAKAVWGIHHLHCSMAEEANQPIWTQTATADSIGMSSENVSVILAVAEALNASDPTIQEAGGIRAAYNILSRRQERVMGDALNTLLAPGKPAAASSPLVVNPIAATGSAFPITLPPIPVSQEETSILNTSFLTWAPAYEGQPFNLLHCDFPYGIGLDKSEQAKSANWDEKYDDSDEVFWQLCHCLATNLDRLMSPSSHLWFWCPSDLIRQYEIITFLQETCPSLSFTTVPYIWHKTDNRGILPDPKRGGRRVYETALLASRGDRFIVRSVSNAYGSPSSKDIHQSEKPEPMLRHYFQMLVDENTRLLDPTCGSATALRAAESLGAESVLGLEVNPGYVEAARIALRRSRLKAQAASARL